MTAGAMSGHRFAETSTRAGRDRHEGVAFTNAAPPVTVSARVGQFVTFENLRLTRGPGGLLMPDARYPACAELVGLPLLVPTIPLRTPRFQTAGDCHYEILYVSLGSMRGVIVVR